jgi:D-arabinose 1-dehydrogenase-like Zn-dependent alcohol dehydrogenase
MLFDGFNVRTSLVASRAMHDEMLQFSVKHGIKTAVETFPLNEKGIATALEKLQSNSMRYRGVLVAE